MAFTDHCDLFASVHEEGVNRVINHIMRQRPSLFNYATADIAHNRELWCAKVEFTPDVPKYGNPLFTIMDPFPILGADWPPVGIGFIVQLTRIQIDFHPGNVISLPDELSPPLKKQRFALELKVCGALACPSDKDIESIPIPPPDTRKENRKTPPPVVLRGQLQCFCLEVFVVGHFERQLINGKESIVGKVDGIEIVDIKPDGLENNVECYMKTMINVLLREKLTIAVETLTMNFPLFGLATVTLFPTPNPPVPNNPAIEDDQLKVFISMNVV
jgi:hypothetical protein